MSEIYICIQCSTYLKGKGKYCKDCDTAEKRKKMDEENIKFFAEGGSVFKKDSLSYSSKLC